MLSIIKYTLYYLVLQEQALQNLLSQRISLAHRLCQAKLIQRKLKHLPCSMAVHATQAKRVTDEMFIEVAAQVLADLFKTRCTLSATTAK